MEYLHAPWRIPYIKAASDEDQEHECFLCGAWEGSDDRAALVLLRKNPVFVVMNKYPYNGGHLMICPVAHQGELEDLPKETRTEMWETTLEMKLLLQKVMNPHAFNIGINLGRPAGAGLPGHVHIHVVPRWNGDTNFMPVIADTTVVSQAIDETWEELKAAL
jgi:ATP adenylyltransferase